MVVLESSGEDKYEDAINLASPYSGKQLPSKSSQQNRNSNSKQSSPTEPPAAKKSLTLGSAAPNLGSKAGD
ncbi:hypothetical protein SLE2022_318500 [Rubroshorea leprosula]